MLEQKSLHQLRQIAQGYGIPDIFAKTDVQLRQLIGLKQQEMQPKPTPEPVKIPYDARLMTRPPSKICTPETLRELLDTHIKQGLHITFTDEEWSMVWGKRTDSGTMRQPLRNVLECANRLIR
jgi:hypothetical protein